MRPQSQRQPRHRHRHRRRQRPVQLSTRPRVTSADPPVLPRPRPAGRPRPYDLQSCPVPPGLGRRPRRPRRLTPLRRPRCRRLRRPRPRSWRTSRQHHHQLHHYQHRHHPRPCSHQRRHLRRQHLVRQPPWPRSRSPGSAPHAVPRSDRHQALPLQLRDPRQSDQLVHQQRRLQAGRPALPLAPTTAGRSPGIAAAARCALATPAQRQCGPLPAASWRRCRRPAAPVLRWLASVQFRPWSAG